MSDLNSVGQTDFDNFLEPGFPIATDTEEFVANVVIPAKTVLARFTGGGSAGKMTVYDSAGSNGQNVPFCIAVNDIDTTSSKPVFHPVYKSAAVNGNRLLFANTSDSLTYAVKDALQRAGIFIRNWVEG
jgi:hypothetical protein